MSAAVETAFTSSRPSTFLVMVTGQLETVQFPEFNEVYAKFWYVFGKEWKIIAGVENGMTQVARRTPDERQIFAFNFPLEVTFQSTTPHGWPQIIIAVYGQDFMGRDVIAGYGATHVSFCPGRTRLRLPMFVPESATLFQKFMAWMFGRRPEFVRPSIIAENEGREVSRVRTQGSLWLSLQAVTKDTRKMGFDLSSPAIFQAPSFPDYVSIDQNR